MPRRTIRFERKPQPRSAVCNCGAPGPLLNRGGGVLQCPGCRQKLDRTKLPAKPLAPTPAPSVKVSPPGMPAAAVATRQPKPKAERLPVMPWTLVEFGKIPCVGTVDATGRVSIVEPRYTIAAELPEEDQELPEGGGPAPDDPTPDEILELARCMRLARPGAHSDPRARKGVAHVA